MLSAELVTDVRWECVHFVTPDEIPRTLRDQLGAEGYGTFELDGAVIQTKEELLSAIARGMMFPYFGMNWDALVDCLRDMAWTVRRGYVLIFDHAESFWSRSSRVGGTLVEVWLVCAEYWARHNVPFHLIFVW